MNISVFALEYNLILLMGATVPEWFWFSIQILNPDPTAMTKLITENASEEFLHSLSNYCGLQVGLRKPLLSSLDMVCYSCELEMLWLFAAETLTCVSSCRDLLRISLG